MHDKLKLSGLYQTAWDKSEQAGISVNPRAFVYRLAKRVSSYSWELTQIKLVEDESRLPGQRPVVLPIKNRFEMTQLVRARGKVAKLVAHVRGLRIRRLPLLLIPGPFGAMSLPNDAEMKQMMSDVVR